MPKIETPETLTDMPVVIIKNVIALATSGFGVVVALAWNEVIQNAVKNYIDPYLGKNSGMVSLLIYAVIMTILAIIVTMQLGNFQKRLETISLRKKKKTKKI
jgi:hypothetical protein